jgi:hypothetical protein
VLLSAPGAYMEKIAIGLGYPHGIVALDVPPEENIAALAWAKGVNTSAITALILDRPRLAADRPDQPFAKPFCQGETGAVEVSRNWRKRQLQCANTAAGGIGDRLDRQRLADDDADGGVAALPTRGSTSRGIAARPGSIANCCRARLQQSEPLRAAVPARLRRHPSPCKRDASSLRTSLRK